MSDLFSRLAATAIRNVPVRSRTGTTDSQPLETATSDTGMESSPAQPSTPIHEPAHRRSRSDHRNASKEVGARTAATHRPTNDEAPIEHTAMIDYLTIVAQAQQAVAPMQPPAGAASRDGAGPHDPVGSVASAVPSDSVAVAHSQFVDASPRPEPPVWISQAAQQTDAAAPRAQPTVQIHIGRLDVRASSDTQNRPQESERSAKGHTKSALSLDDYLRGSKAAP